MQNLNTVNMLFFCFLFVPLSPVNMIKLIDDEDSNT